jgi:hypothetical protein
MAILSEATRTDTAFSAGRQHPGQAIRYSLAEVNTMMETKAMHLRPVTNRHRP